MNARVTGRHRRVLLALLLAGPVPLARAADPPPPAATVLLRQAAFWTAHNAPDQARASLRRLLRLDPGNADALASLGGLELGLGHPAAAAAALAALRAVAPADRRVARLDGAIRVAALPPAALETARRLAAEGQADQALAQYDRVLAGITPPVALAIEYDRVLAASTGGWTAARDALAALVREDPDDLAAQLAYAETLTRRLGARAEGIERLRLLAEHPAVAAAATAAWRAALLWLPDTPGAVPAIQAFLSRHADAELAAKRARAGAVPAQPDATTDNATDNGTGATADGFAALAAGRLDAATAAFQRALASRDHAAAAWGGLGLVRLHQGDPAGARPLLARAAASDPDHADRWRRALALADPAPPDPCLTRLATGDWAGAAAALRARIDAGDPDPAAPLLLAEAQTRLGHRADAEATLRAALARRPEDGRALVALATLLDDEGRAADAGVVLARARAVGAGPLLAEAAAQRLRQRAGGDTDPATRLALLRTAAATAPADPWVRLDLARALVAAGRGAEARVLMARLVAAATPDDATGLDALRAGAVFARETGETATAAALSDRLPAAARDAAPELAATEPALRRAIALALLDPATARAPLLLLAARPDPTGARGAALARALVAAGHPDAAATAIALAEAATPRPSPDARLTHAGALIDLGALAAADRDLPAPDGLTPAEAAALARTREALDVRRAEALGARGQPAAAFDLLAPALAARPADPALDLAVARLFQDAGRPRDARATAEAVLRRDPTNAGARLVAVTAALAAGDRARAGVLAREGMQLTPLDPAVWLAAAALAHAGHDDAAALRALRRARLLRANALRGNPAPGDAPDLVAPDPVAPDAAAIPASIELPLLDPGDLRAPPGDASLATPPALDPSGGPALARETDEDGDQVMVRRRMLDTDVTDLPPPLAPGQAPPPAFVDTRPPVPVVTATSVETGDGGPTPAPAAADPLFGTAPLVGTAPTRPPANPFRDATQAVPSPGAAPTRLADLEAPATAADPMTARIDQDIAALTDPTAAGIGVAGGFRGRSGDAGTSQLAEITIPLEARFAAGGGGTIGLAVTPTWLNAGSVPGNSASQARFGTLALATPVPGVSAAGVAVSGQRAYGTGLDVAYRSDEVSADAGATPLGFRQENAVGGLEWVPTLDQGVRLRLSGERRAVTDSLLSYAGTRDPRTDATWGGVTYARGHANLEMTGPYSSAYIGVGGGLLEGQDVKSNTEIEAGAGLATTVYEAPGQNLRLGLDLIYYGFAKNLGGFTLGQGGYFSPQTYVAALIPLTFTDQPTRALSYEIGITAGVQTFREAASATYPNDAALQTALVAQQANPATAVPGAATTYPGKNETGFSGGAHGRIDYGLTDTVRIGARVDYQHTGDYNQLAGVLYGRYLFGGRPGQ